MALGRLEGPARRALVGAQFAELVAFARLSERGRRRASSTPNSSRLHREMLARAARDHHQKREARGELPAHRSHVGVHLYSASAKATRVPRGITENGRFSDAPPHSVPAAWHKAAGPARQPPRVST